MLKMLCVAGSDGAAPAGLEEASKEALTIPQITSAQPLEAGDTSTSCSLWGLLHRAKGPALRTGGSGQSRNVFQQPRRPGKALVASSLRHGIQMPSGLPAGSSCTPFRDPQVDAH